MVIQLDFFYQVNEMESLVQELEKVDKSLVNVNRNLQGKIAALREQIEKKLQKEASHR